MPRACFAFSFALSLVLCCNSCGEATRDGTQRPPNVVFFLTDDQGWGDAGFAGHPYLLTPNLDRLASQGTWFQQFYVGAPTCSPSRVAFMTGEFPTRHRIHSAFSSTLLNEKRGMPDWLDPDVVTLADMLHAAGYRTAHFGKWHLCGRGGTPPTPDEYGFDVHRALSGNQAVDEWTTEEEADIHFRTTSTQLFVDEAIEFIRSTDDEPFFANIWTTAVHTPVRPRREQLARYSGLRVRPRDFDEPMRSYVGSLSGRSRRMRTYAAALSSMDDALGRLLDFLAAEGLADNTIVIFASDNGPEDDSGAADADNPAMGSTGNLSGRKASLGEGGIRTPFVVRWPGHIEEGRVDSSTVLAAVDLLPTLAVLAGVPELGADVDGEDMSEALLSGPRERSSALFWRIGNGAAAIRKGRWKLTLDEHAAPSGLFDVVAAPGERVNQLTENPGTAEDLQAMLMEWMDTLP